MKTLKIGIVGLGGICRERHIPGLRKIPEVEIMGVVNSSPESTAKVAREFGIPKTYTHWEELVHDPEIDIVWIGTWPYLHAPVSISALDAGKHVFCQARMAMDYFEAQQMFEAVCRSGKVAGLCPVPFGLTFDKTIARLRREGQLGNIYLVRVTSLSDFNLDPNKPLHWRKNHHLSGHNVLTLGMYIEVIHRWFGWTKEVFANTKIFTPERKTQDGQIVQIQIPDQVSVVSELRSGTVVQYSISGMSHIQTETIEIYAQKMCLLYDVLEDKLYHLLPPKKRVEIIPVHEDFYDVKHWAVERDFIDAVLYGKPYHPNFEDGLRYMEVLDAVYTSAQTGEKVELRI